MTDAVLDQAKDSIARGSKSFGMAARFLPDGQRQDCVMLYAWCRHADDVIDGQEGGFSLTPGGSANPDPSDDPSARLTKLRRNTDLALSGGDVGGPDAAVYAGLARVVERRGIAHRHIHELLDGFQMDVRGRVYHDMDDVLDYAYHVAGVVGVMMGRIMDVRSNRVLDCASDLGIAFQLTNIARDVIDDARIGRSYLPQDLLARQGITTIDPGDPSRRAGLYNVAIHVLDVAEDYYRSADAGIAALPRRPALSIAAARNIYRAIGSKLRRQGPDAWNGRLSTSTAEKLILIARAAGQMAYSRGRKQGQSAGREGLYQRPTS